MSRQREQDEDDGKVRLDKWLWAARFYKTRQLAHEALELGRVLVNGERVKASRIVREGMNCCCASTSWNTALPCCNWPPSVVRPRRRC
jgi:ribosomal 50S subunit-recycling heat shock protein